ncbi:MAG: serine/threonine-protein phosphatase, partial [Phycisphaerales bacterium]|nr:serine/threonine-protein phosphatase [Phycisphaerales bacterium]
TAGSNSRFATAVYGIYDNRNCELTIAGAGHPAPILVRADGSGVERPESTGPLLGVFPDIEFGETTLKMRPKDVLVLFSDGFEVAFPKHDAVGDDRKRPTERYIGALTQAGKTGGLLEHAINTLEGQLDAQLGSLHQPDDITALFFSPSCEPVASEKNKQQAA